MSTQTFIKFDGIDGESTHQDHKGEVEVRSWVSAAGADVDAVEEVAMSYRTIDFAYSPQTSKGSLGTPVQFNWDIAAGKVS